MILARAKWVTIHGSKYKVGSIIHIGWSADECPLFWKINKVAVINRIVSQIMFVISEIKTLHFNKHYQCYEVAVPTRRQVKIAYYNDFSCYLPYNESRAQGHQASRNHKFVCVRYDLDCC